MPGNLYIVATPIGNLSDITLRAIETLKSVDLVLCEDTRVTRNLLANLKIEKTTESYHQHSTLAKTDHIAALLREGKNLALVSDAGTPGISDPGNKLIEQLAGIFAGELRVIAIPGPSALSAALSVCGFNCDRFSFFGFPPAKNKRKKFFETIAAQGQTAAFYESTHRILRTMKELDEVNPDKKRKAVVCRELTKTFETVLRGTLTGVTEKLRSGETRGEFVIILEGKGRI